MSGAVRNRLDTDLYTHRGLQLATVLVVGLLARMIVFPDVAINGDSGLYLYDAKQLLWGRQIFVDFPSRSPAFEWLLAGAVAVGDSPIVAARTLMVAISIAVGVATYYFAREIRGHTSGLAAAALFLFSPFTIVWGTWIKTEQAATLVVIIAFVLALRRIDDEALSVRIPIAIGALFALAWQIRRVVIVHIGAFCLFVIWYRYQQQSDIIGTVRAAGVVVASAIGMTGLAYLLVAAGDLNLALDVAYTHGAALFLSSGQGSLGWVGLDSAQAVTAASTGGILAQLCQKCGANTIETFQRTLMVTLPLFALWMVLLRAYTREGSRFWGEKALPAMLAVLSAFALFQAALAGRPLRMLAATALLAIVATVWLGPAVEWQHLWTPKLGLPIIVLVGLTAGYLYRDRILYVTYFQDFYPFVCVVGGVVLVEYALRVKIVSGPEWLSEPRYMTILLAGIALTGGLTGAVAATTAYPYQPGGPPDNTAWHSIDSIQATGDNIDQRVGANETVWTAQPLYAVESDRQITANLSRKFYAFRGWPKSEEANQTARELAGALRSESVPYAVVDSEAYWVLERERVREALQNNYCRVDAPKYERTGGQLYEYRNDTQDCDTYEHPKTPR